jgi:hypothetical protein
MQASLACLWHLSQQLQVEGGSNCKWKVGLVEMEAEELCSWSGMPGGNCGPVGKHKLLSFADVLQLLGVTREQQLGAWKRGSCWDQCFGLTTCMCYINCQQCVIWALKRLFRARKQMAGGPTLFVL